MMLCDEKVNQSLRLRHDIFFLFLLNKDFFSQEKKYFVQESFEIQDLREEQNSLKRKIGIIENNLKGELKLFHENLFDIFNVYLYNFL